MSVEGAYWRLDMVGDIMWFMTLLATTPRKQNTILIQKDFEPL